MRRLSSVKQDLDSRQRNDRVPELGRRFALRRHVAWCLLVGLLFAGGSALAANFTTSLDRSLIQMGETARLLLQFEDASPDDVPVPPSVPNLQIDYLGPSSQTSIINGQVSSSVTHMFSVTPRQPGDYTIPAITDRKSVV